MSYSNSPLVSYTKLSPNNSGQRTHKIDTVTIHCVVAQASVEALGDLFASKSAQSSANYAIGADGRIALIVEEKNRSWCSSSEANDQRAITIEVASDSFHPYAVNEKAYASLIRLLTDICRRNGIKKLLWRADKALIGQTDKQNMTVHRWFANKACPGDWLYSRHGQIAEAVNENLKEKSEVKAVFRVQIGAFTDKANAEKTLEKAKAAGFNDAFISSGNTAQEVKPTQPTAVKKSLDEIAKEVIEGKWGVGDDRKQRLLSAGYDPSAVQDRVNRLM